MFRSRRPDRCSFTWCVSGFSLIEVLIAMALAGLLLVGVLPLFTKSMTNNVEGNQLTEVTNRARLHLEELMAMRIDAEELTVPDGEKSAGYRRDVLAHRGALDRGGCLRRR